MLRHRRRELIVIASASLAALGGGVAVAASTNTLPFAADHGQTTAATAAPSTSNPSNSPRSTSSAPEPVPALASELSTPNGEGPDATGPAKYGLCSAYAAGQGTTNGNKADSTAFQALAAAAGGANNIAGFCAGATPGGKDSPPGPGPTHADNGQGAEHADRASTEHGPGSDPGSQGQGADHRP